MSTAKLFGQFDSGRKDADVMLAVPPVMLFVILGRKLGLSDEQLMGTAEKAAGMGGADEQGPPQPGDADPDMGGASLETVTSDGGQSMPPNPDDMRKGVM